MYNGGYLRKALYFARTLAKSMYKGITSLLPPSCDGKLIQYVEEPPELGVYIDLVGDRDPASRIGGFYLSAGTIVTGLISTSLTYTDATTLLPVVDTTDGSGDFAVPANGIVDLTIDGHYFPLEESTGLYVGATDGEYYGVTGLTWVNSDFVPSYADENGYTVGDSSYMFWDELLTIPIEDGVNVTSGAGWKDESVIYVTDDDYIYVTSDGYIYVTK